MTLTELPDVSLKVLAESLDAIRDLRDNASYQKIVEFTGKRPTYIERALQIGIELGIVKENEKKDGNGYVDTVFTLDHPLTQSPHDEIKTAFSRYEPFTYFCLRLSKGEKPTVAARKTKALFRLDNNDDEIVARFTTWGIYCGFIDRKKGVIKLTFQITSPVEDPIDSKIENRISASAFVQDSLGKHLSCFSSHEIELLTNAILEYGSNPRNSIDDAGRAVEDQLRSIAKQANVDVTKKNGIIEITIEIKTQNRNFLHGKHFELFCTLGHMRNMATHSKDRATEIPWIISKEFALTYCMMALRTLASSYNYIEDGRRQEI